MEQIEIRLLPTPTLTSPVEGEEILNFLRIYLVLFLNKPNKDSFEKRALVIARRPQADEAIP